MNAFGAQRGGRLSRGSGQKEELTCPLLPPGSGSVGSAACQAAAAGGPVPGLGHGGAVRPPPR